MAAVSSKENVASSDKTCYWSLVRLYWLRANLTPREQVLQDTLVEMIPHLEAEDIVVVEEEASTSHLTLNSDWYID
jgi:hypothetical protein